MRILWALLFLFAAGCGGPDLTTYDGIADAMVEVRTDLADALEGITDAESAKAARPTLLKIAKREGEVYAALKKLGEPEGEEKRRLKAKLDPTMEKIGQRMETAMDRLQADHGTWAVVDPIMQEYFATADPQGAERQAMAQRVADMNSMRLLAGLVMTVKTPPLRDGAFDPYAFVKSGEITREDYDTFRSACSGKGPTDEEIERGDYTNFPWERYRGDGSEIRKAVMIPLLWEREPGSDGKYLVAWNDGSCLLTSAADLKAALGR